MREELLRSLLAADLIAFQSYDYLRHFCTTLLVVLGLESNMLTVEPQSSDSHITHLRVFPVSIDSHHFISQAASLPVQQRVHELREGSTSSQLVLGVDRLDYTKGIDLKLLAFENMLERYPEMRETVRLLQLAVPSRTEVRQYQKLREDIEKLVGRINGRFGKPNLVPVHYVFSKVDFDELLALYRHANVMLVTSKRDGMNLVALEYVAAQDPQNPGMICLSEFTGAAYFLSHPLRVNPWDIQGTADALYHALTAPQAERIERHRPMLQRLERYTATHWARGFMEQLQQTTRTQPEIEVPPETGLEELIEQVDGRPLVILCDYDGTLVPICNFPEDAVLSQRLYQRVQTTVTQSYGVHWVIISGRTSAFLETQFRSLPVDLAAEHGAFFRRQGGGEWQSLVRTHQELWYTIALHVMEDFAGRTTGSVVERKQFSVAWHYRNAPQPFGEHQARSLLIELEAALANLPASILYGNKVVEARTVEANKGAFCRWLLEQQEVCPKDIQILALGDDTTDEDMFVLLPEDAVTIRVGRVPSRARFCLSSQTQVLPLLEALIQRRNQYKRSQ